MIHALAALGAAASLGLALVAEASFEPATSERRLREPAGPTREPPGAVEPSLLGSGERWRQFVPRLSEFDLAQRNLAGIARAATPSPADPRCARWVSPLLALKDPGLVEDGVVVFTRCFLID
jgi:hypothetical protein